MSQAALVLLALLPYGVLRYFFGSVNLIEDLQMLGAMFLGSAILTAATVWMSGQPKFFRVLVPVLIVIFFQVGASALFGRSRSPLGRLGSTSEVAAALLALYYGGLLLSFFLIQAVRRLAPGAENHSPVTRLLGVAAFLPAIGLAIAQKSSLVGPAMGVGLIALFFVITVELASGRPLMPVHCRNLSSRGRLLGWLGRLVLPGWPSAVLFAALVLAVFAVASLWAPARVFPGPSERAAWISVLAWQALVFPAVALSFAGPSTGLRLAGAAYFVFHGVFGIISAVAGSKVVGLTGAKGLASALETVAEVLPVSSFWMSLGKRTTPEPGEFIAQAIILVVLLAVAVLQSRPYWARVREWSARRADETTVAR